MNLVLCLESFRVDGTVGLFLRIARHFVTRGYRIRVFGADGPLIEAFRSVGAQVRICDGLARESRQSMQDAILQMREAFEAERPDAIVAAAARPFPAAEAAVSGSIPVFYFVLSSDLFAETEGPLVAAAAKADRVLALSILDARVHGAYFDFDAAKVLVCPIPIEPPLTYERAAAREQLDAMSDEIVALTVGRLDDDRIASIPPFLTAVARLRGNGIPIRAVVVGDGTHMNAMRALGGPDVTFTGTLFDLDPLYAAADVYCGEGTTKHEATVRAIPTLVTAAQARLKASDRVLHINGIQSSPTTSIEPCSIIPTMSFEDALTLIASDLNRFKKLATQAAARILREHSTERFMDWLLDVLSGSPRSVVPVDTAGGDPLVIDADRRQFQRAAETVCLEPERYALTSRSPIPWDWFCELDSSCWAAVALAARRNSVS
jgi:hypothetical protein